MKKIIFAMVIGLMASSTSLAASYACSRAYDNWPEGILTINGKDLYFAKENSKGYPPRLELVNGVIYNGNYYGSGPVGSISSSPSGGLTLKLAGYDQMTCR